MVQDKLLPCPQSQGCTVPPEGWFCTRAPGHEGPCAAHPERSHDKAGGLWYRRWWNAMERVSELEAELAANARLISCAPEMLTELQNASWLLADISPDGLVKKQIDAVIAKATGAA